MGGVSPAVGAAPATVAAVAAELGVDVEHAARAVLSRLGEPGEPALVRALRQHTAEELLERLLSGASVGEVSDRRARIPPGATAATMLAADLRVAGRLGVRLVVPGDAAWPTQLDDLGDAAPVVLWVRGGADLRLTVLRSVSIVGSRTSTGYGDHVAADLAAGLAERGWAVVSGGAFGIDAAAHRGALAVGGASVAVLACGIDVVYPRAHESLFARLLDDGLVLSEAPPGAAPYRHRFLVRNRVIAALTRGTVVVEAAARSGSLATARHAMELGRVVMGVPGPVTSGMSQGTHQLLRDGALLVGCVDEVVDAVGTIGADLGPAVRGPEEPWDALDETSRRVLDALPPRRAADTSTLAVAAGVDPATALATLGLLELAGFVARHRDGWRLLRRDAPTPPVGPG